MWGGNDLYPPQAETAPVQTSNILCCICGTQIEPNPANMCSECLRSRVDITKDIPKAALESAELLTLCIKRVKGLQKVRLVDAGWIFTEPHSRRLKINLTVQKEVFTTMYVQQSFVVEFVVQNNQCPICERREAKDTWNAACQLRQHVVHKRTFFYLEQLILRHNAHANCSNIVERRDGLDFFFQTASHCKRFVEFVQSVVPASSARSKKLISQDANNNTYNYKYTWSTEILPFSKDDLVYLPPATANHLGQMNPFALVARINSLVHLIDPLTLKTAELDTTKFRQHETQILGGYSNLILYTILDVTMLGPARGKLALAEVEVARDSDLGRNDTTYRAVTHLGNLLKVGDMALGYDLQAMNLNEAEIEVPPSRTPDVILVAKSYPERPRNRHWKLRHLDKESELRPDEAKRQERDYELFLQSLESDPELRSTINLYKDCEHSLTCAERNAEQIFRERQRKVEDKMQGDEPAFPDVQLDELLDDLEGLHME